MSVKLLTQFLATVAASTVPLAVLANRAQTQEAPTIAGTWTLNADKTEEARDRTIEDAEGTGVRTVRTGLGGRGGRGGGGGTSSGGGGRANRATLGLMFGGMMRASKTLKIAQADSLVTMDDENGPLFLNLRADGKSLDEQLTDKTVLKTKAQWKKTDLIIERSHEVNGSARMIFKIDPKNPKVMTVEFHYEHKRQRRTIDQKRTYDAAQ